MPDTELRLGDRPPLFHLEDQDGHATKLADLLGKQAVVLIFYPGDLTPGCTLQLGDIRDAWDRFTRANVAVFGVNSGNADTHRSFRDTCHLPFPLLVDAKSKVSAAYGATTKRFGATVIRRTVVGIGADGTIAYLRRGMPKASDILKNL